MGAWGLQNLPAQPRPPSEKVIVEPGLTGRVGLVCRRRAVLERAHPVEGTAEARARRCGWPGGSERLQLGGGRRGRRHKGPGEAGSDAGLGVWGSARGGERSRATQRPEGILLWRPLSLTRAAVRAGGRAREGWAQLVGPGAEPPDRLLAQRQATAALMDGTLLGLEGRDQDPRGVRHPVGKTQPGRREVLGGWRCLGRSPGAGMQGERQRQRERETHHGVGRGRCPLQRCKQSPPQRGPGAPGGPEAGGG